MACTRCRPRTCWTSSPNACASSCAPRARATTCSPRCSPPARTTTISALLARTEAVAALLGTEDGTNLLTAYRRAANILRIEERKDGPHDGAPDRDLLETGGGTDLARRA